MSIKLLTILISSLILLLVVELIRKERLTFKYALAWITVSAVAIFLTVFDRLLFRLADFFGFELPSNFIFFSLLTVFVFLSLLITYMLGEQNSRNDTIAQKIAMLEFEIDELKKKQNFNSEDFLEKEVKMSK